MSIEPTPIIPLDSFDDAAERWLSKTLGLDGVGYRKIVLEAVINEKGRKVYRVSTIVGDDVDFPYESDRLRKARGLFARGEG